MSKGCTNAASYRIKKVKNAHLEKRAEPKWNQSVVGSEAECNENFPEPNRSATKAPLAAVKTPRVTTASFIYELTALPWESTVPIRWCGAPHAFGVIWLTLFQGSFPYNFCRRVFHRAKCCVHCEPNIL